jgi:hypothetical protein
MSWSGAAMSNGTSVSVTTEANWPPTSGTIKLPENTTTLPQGRVMLQAGDKKGLLRVDYRTDGGDAACLSAMDHRRFGEPTTVQYRGVGTLEAIRRDSALRLAAMTALVTFASAVLGVWVAYDKATATTPATETTAAKGPDETTLWVAAAVAVLAFVIAFLKVRKDLKEL